MDEVKRLSRSTLGETCGSNGIIVLTVNQDPPKEDPRLFSRSSSHCSSLQGGNSYQTLHTLPLHLIKIQLKLCSSFLIFVKKQTKKKHPKSLFATYVDAQRTRVHVSSFTLVWSALVLALTYYTGGKCHTASALLAFIMRDSAGRQNHGAQERSTVQTHCNTT